MVLPQEWQLLGRAINSVRLHGATHSFKPRFCGTTTNRVAPLDRWGWSALSNCLRRNCKRLSDRQNRPIESQIYAHHVKESSLDMAGRNANANDPSKERIHIGSTSTREFVFLVFRMLTLALYAASITSSYGIQSGWTCRGPRGNSTIPRNK